MLPTGHSSQLLHHRRHIHRPNDIPLVQDPIGLCRAERQVYDYISAKNNMVLLRYSPGGSHCGAAHSGIEASGRKEDWTATAIFELEDGKIKGWTKERDKLNMWKQLGWMNGDEYV